MTNAQFPDAIRDLTPVTQLYVSIDASTKDSLKKIDRPLFKDFWERFIESLVELEKKGQRTVYRLTLVKGWNAEEMENYARLVDIGKPDFIEVKGVTYCGTSKGKRLFRGLISEGKISSSVSRFQPRRSRWRTCPGTTRCSTLSAS